MMADSLEADMKIDFFQNSPNWTKELLPQDSVAATKRGIYTYTEL